MVFKAILGKIREIIRFKNRYENWQIEKKTSQGNQ